MFDEMSLLLSVCFDKYVCYICLCRQNYVKILLSFVCSVQIKIGELKGCSCCDFIIIFEYSPFNVDFNMCVFIFIYHAFNKYDIFNCILNTAIVYS